MADDRTKAQRLAGALDLLAATDEFTVPGKWSLRIMDTFPLLTDAATLLREQAAELERLRAEAAWVSVTERLPDYEQSVLLYRPPRAGSAYDPVVFIRPRYRRNKGPFQFDCIEAPTHWRPLPAPPDTPQPPAGGEEKAR